MAHTEAVSCWEIVQIRWRCKVVDWQEGIKG